LPYIPFVRTLLVFCFIAFFSAEKTFAQKVVLDLNWENETPKETEYQIIEVLDHRIQKASIGEVFERGGHKLPVTFKENLDQLATRFYLQNLNPRDSAQEIQVRIFEMELEEIYDEGKSFMKEKSNWRLGSF
jgi:dihydroneopterin aldolase